MNWLTKTKTFVSEVRSELKKVSFPSRSEVISTTIVVIVTSFVFALFLWLADMAILKAYGFTVKVLGT